MLHCRIEGIAADENLLRRWQSASTIWLASLPGAAAARQLHEAFALYLDRCDGAARLIVLADAPPADIALLRAAVAKARIDAHVELLVAQPPATVKAALLSADALLASTGDPLVEAAMAVGTPIVAFGASGGFEAALSWSDDDPALLAASVEHLRGDAGLRAQLRSRGFARVGGAP